MVMYIPNEYGMIGVQLYQVATLYVQLYTGRCINTQVLVLNRSNYEPRALDVYGLANFAKMSRYHDS